MRNLFFFLASTIYLVSANDIIGQQRIATVKLGTSEIKNVVSFQSGDTLLVSYAEDREIGRDIIKAFHVFPDGSTSDLSLKNIPIAFFCGFETSADGIFDYYFGKEKNGKITLKALFTGNHRLQETLSGEILIEGKVIGVFNNHGIKIIARNESKNSILVYNIARFQKVRVDEVPLTERFSYISTQEMQLISPATGWIYESNSKAKVYVSKQKIFMSRDHQSGTDIISFDQKEGKTKSIFIPERVDPNCNSFLCDSLLFRLSINKTDFSIKIYDLEGDLLNKRSFKVEERNGDTKVYSHSKLEYKTSHDEKLLKNFKTPISINCGS